MLCSLLLTITIPRLIQVKEAPKPTTPVRVRVGDSVQAFYTGQAQQWFNNGMYSLSEDQTADLEKVLSNGQFRDSPRVLRENLRRRFGCLHFSPSIFLSRSRNSEISWSFLSSALSTLSAQSFMRLVHRLPV